MESTAAEHKTVLVIHQDPSALDVITRSFEGQGYDVAAALTAFRAQAYLEGEREIHVIVAQWDPAHSVGGEVYRWVIQRRFDLRSQFVFVGEEPPASFERMVAGRCLQIGLDNMSEILAAAEAAVARVKANDAASVSEIAIGLEAPSVLLADDDPTLLLAMSRSLKDLGYQVTSVDSGNSAIAQLATQDFDAILVDWQMDDGSGAEFLRWMSEKRPDLSDRVIVLTGTNPEPIAKVSMGCPVLPKGQDGAALRELLERIVQTVRDEEWR